MFSKSLKNRLVVCGFAAALAAAASSGTASALAPLAKGTVLIRFVPVIENAGSAYPRLRGDQVHNGDWDGSGKVEITDLYLMARHLFASGSPPALVTCMAEMTVAAGGSGKGDGVDDLPGELFGSTPSYQNGDIDASGTLNISDLVRLARFLFVGGVQAPAKLGCDPTDIAV